jgi:putative transposase
LLHGRSSRQWNQEERTPGRKCWFGCADRTMRSEAHYWATLNYIHHNPVHHGYVEKWQDWPYSSAAGWIEKVGATEAKRLWQAFPILEYGKGWDEAGM